MFGLPLQKTIGFLIFIISLLVVIFTSITLRDKECKIDNVECTEKNQDFVFSKTGKIMLVIFLPLLLLGMVLCVLPDFNTEI